MATEFSFPDTAAKAAAAAEGIRDREDVALDGAVASVDARRAAPADGTRRRDRDEVRPGHRLPAPRRREDRREHDLQPVRALHGPAGLPRAAREQHGLRHRGRAAREARGAGALPGDPRDHGGNGARLGAPDGPRRLRHRCRRVDGVHVLLHRSARNSTSSSRS